jgi:hypothetical protein
MARRTGSRCVLCHLARNVTVIRVLRFLLSLVGRRRRWHLPLGCLGGGLLCRRCHGNFGGGGHTCASTGFDVPRRIAREACACRIDMTCLPNKGTVTLARVIRPKPGRALPVRDDKFGRPAQGALTARRAANPRVRDLAPHGRRPAPVAAGLGAPWAGLSEREAEAVFADGAHLALLTLTRCGRWTFSRTTPSTGSRQVGDRLPPCAGVSS